MTAGEIYSSPFVTHIRTALDNYQRGSTIGIEETAIGSEEIGCGLDAYDQNYYKSPFVLASAQDGEYGSVIVDILFVDQPDSVFTAWVYELDTGDMVLRSFCKTGPSAEQQAEFDAMIEDTISDEDESMMTL